MSEHEARLDHPVVQACRDLVRAIDAFDEAAAAVLGVGRSDLRALNLLEDRVAAHASAGRVNAERQRAERELAAELDAIGLLQRLGSRFIREEGNDNFHERIVDTAMTLMGADCGSMQLLEPRTNTLRLLAWKGFHSESAKYWETVTLETGTTCGLALKLGERLTLPFLERPSLPIHQPFELRQAAARR